jgi:hypothetical protein
MSPLHSTQRLSPSWVPEGARTLPHLASPYKGEEFKADTFPNKTSRLACTHGKPGSTKFVKGKMVLVEFVEEQGAASRSQSMTIGKMQS